MKKITLLFLTLLLLLILSACEYEVTVKEKSTNQLVGTADVKLKGLQAPTKDPAQDKPVNHVPVPSAPKQESARWYAVKLVTEEIYYGQISDTAADPIVISNAYYNYDQIKEREEQSESRNLKLVKRGKETHGPEGTMNIVRSQVVYMEPLKEDSKILRAILGYQSSTQTENPNPSGWYSVRLLNNEVYYGQIPDIKADPLVITNVYYNYDQMNPVAEGNLRLVKKGRGINGSDGNMTMDTAQVVFTEELSQDSKVYRAILDYEK